jgi:hypothetical protein
MLNTANAKKRRSSCFFLDITASMDETILRGVVGAMEPVRNVRPNVRVDLNEMRKAVSSVYAFFGREDLLQVVAAACRLFLDSLVDYEPYALGLAHLHVFSTTLFAEKNHDIREDILCMAFGPCTSHLGPSFYAVVDGLREIDSKWCPVLGSHMRALVCLYPPPLPRPPIIKSHIDLFVCI